MKRNAVTANENGVCESMLDIFYISRGNMGKHLNANHVPDFDCAALVVMAQQIGQEHLGIHVYETCIRNMYTKHIKK